MIMTSREGRFPRRAGLRLVVCLTLLVTLLGPLASDVYGDDPPPGTAEAPAEAPAPADPPTPTPEPPTPTPEPPTPTPEPPTPTAEPPTAIPTAAPTDAPPPTTVEEPAAPTRSPRPTRTPRPRRTPAAAAATTWEPFAEDFEAGTLAHWDRVRGLVVQEQLVLAGRYAGRIATTGQHPAYALARLPQPSSELAVRLRVQVVAQGETPITLLALRDEANHPVLLVYLTADGALALEVGPTPERRRSDVTVVPGRWHELRLQVAVAPTGDPGHVAVWLDGAPIEALSEPVFLGSEPLGWLQLGENRTRRVGTVVVDDLLVDRAPIPADPRFVPAP
ncbi:MAG TPA: hypothetical protein VIL01_11905, partial [Thermomicrobiales bacterium]